jgi:GNAT superfamily N-acetyltransferase
VNKENLSDHPQSICFINPKHELYHKKVEWLHQQFEHGLMIKLLYVEDQKKPVGFVEYVPGELCWRAVEAEGYMFIHCLWTNGKKFQHQGLGSRLIEAVEEDAAGMRGVASITSDAAFMASRALFEKNGYSVAETSGREQLVVKSFGSNPLPALRNWQEELEKYQGLHIVYSRQCPWVARFIEEVKPVLAEYQLEPLISDLKTAAEAQHAPSLYAVFALIYDGKLLADRYISTTRFRNIVKKEFGQ